MVIKRVILLMLVAFFVLFSNKIKAQNAEILKNAGIEMKKASNHFYSGTYLQGAGSLTVIIGYGVANPVIIVIGAIVFIVGTIVKFDSYSHLKKAGKMMELAT